MNRPEELIKKIYEEQGHINDVFLTACGGSLVDLYPGYYFINSESETMHSHWMTAREMTVSPSKFLKKRSSCYLMLTRRKYKRNCRRSEACKRAWSSNYHNDT